jgi:hypothetical protein
MHAEYVLVRAARLKIVSGLIRSGSARYCPPRRPTPKPRVTAAGCAKPLLRFRTVREKITLTGP